MTSSVLLLLLEILVTVFGSSEAYSVSCYDCVEAKTTGIDTQQTTCPESLTPSNASTCQGLGCVIIRTDYGSNGYTLNNTCLPHGFLGLPDERLDINQCTSLNYLQSSYVFYVYDDMCCFTTAGTLVQGTSNVTYSRTSCACVDDYCNGDRQLISTTPTTVDTNEMTSEDSRNTNTTNRRTIVISSGTRTHASHSLLVSSTALILTSLAKSDKC